MLSFHVYILICADGSYYVGHTDNLEKRISEHEHGILKCYTLNRRPVKLAFSQEFASREEALQFERQIKGWSRAKKEALINYNWDALVKLSKSRNICPSTGSGRTENKT